ncbi:S1 family peptidase [Pedobacter sp. AW1-32]|uniref:S1 family peptidase n=1 Tax=Pedobacter sp. AW1-32 TaxID=3383026 RepID=UPI003FEF31BE
MIKIKLILLSTILFYFSIQNVKAQEPDGDVTFVNYNALEASLISKVKAVQKIYTFMGTKALKTKTSGLKENTLVKVKNIKINSRKKTAENIASIRKDAVLMIVKYGKAVSAKGEQVEVIASGIVLSEDGVCATNYHVLKPLIEKETPILDKDSLTLVANSNGDVFPIEEILSFNKEGDIALFKINTLKTQLKPIPLGLEALVGAKIFAYTNPYGYLYYFSTGIVARNHAKKQNDAFGNRMEITADYAKGSSGGPIIDEYGNLVGMVSTTHSIYYQENLRTNQQNNLQMVVKSTIPVRTFKKLISFN